MCLEIIVTYLASECATVGWSVQRLAVKWVFSTLRPYIATYGSGFSIWRQAVVDALLILD